MRAPPTLPLGNVFAALLLNPKNVGRLCEWCGRMPNIKMKTCGGIIFWETLAKNNGWALQSNLITGHCRILDPDNYRRAWGSERVLYQLLINLSK